MTWILPLVLMVGLWRWLMGRKKVDSQAGSTHISKVLDQV
jgi:hypothetical protein